MAVERLTDYTRRIWTALGPDAPVGHDIHVNDVIYYMDSSECCIVTNVYPDGSIDCETLPDIGGGGAVTRTDLLLTCRNNTGLSMTQVQSCGWSTVYDMWYPIVGGNVNTGALMFNHAPNRVQRLADGRLAVYFYISTSANHTPGPITYNDEPLETVINGSTRNYSYKIYIPEDYDPDIPIIFN